MLRRMRRWRERRLARWEARVTEAWARETAADRETLAQLFDFKDIGDGVSILTLKQDTDGGETP